MTIQDRVYALVDDYLGCGQKDILALRLREDLGADSFDIIEIGMACEEEFGVNLTDDEVGAYKKPADIIELLISKGCT